VEAQLSNVARAGVLGVLSIGAVLLAGGCGSDFTFNGFDMRVSDDRSVADADMRVTQPDRRPPRADARFMPECKMECDPGDCGAVPDQCGGLLDCPGCEGDDVCGLTKPNRCGTPVSSCTPTPAAQACAGLCGAVSDGCDNVIQCDDSNGGVTCSATQICGGFDGNRSPNQCVDAPTCSPATCEELGAECGLVGDGCNGILDCSANGGGCTGGLVCGTGQNSNHCVQPDVCTPFAASTACAGTCGLVSDGCGSTIDCEANAATRCPAGQTCGGGGVAGQCGSGSTSCTPFVVTTVCAGKCGQVSDGCGGAYQCDGTNGGAVCDPNAGQTCGGAGVPNQCGAPACTPLSRNQACPTNSCGQVGDGCGALIDCGGCTGAGQVCGLTTPNRCGTPTCTPTPVATACAGKCGSVSDGCSGSYNCTSANGGVTCTGTDFCGANAPNTCGTPPTTCTPKNCAQQGHTCGLASDGCGRQINCWPSGTNQQCPDPATQTCVADPVTGSQTCVQGTSPGCTGPLCNSVPTNCGASSPTQLTGRVITPGRVQNGTTINQIPVPNAVVYIPADPAATLPTPFQGVDPTNPASCGRCTDVQLVASGQSVLAAAVTDARGAFTLSGRVPVGTAFNLVVAAGKWRRVVQVSATTASACQTRTLGTAQTRLPAHKTDGLTGTYLPLIAVDTGAVDAMECVLRNIGIAESEFTPGSSGSGRVHMYRAAGTVSRMGFTFERGGARMGPCTGTFRSQGITFQCNATQTINGQSISNFGCVTNQPAGGGGATGCSDQSVFDTQLLGSQTAINRYDVVIGDCQGSSHTTTSNSFILGYVNNGGRLFASHLANTWLDNNSTLDQSSQWQITDNQRDTATGDISLPTGPTARPGANPVKSVQLRDWLTFQGALLGTSQGQTNPPTTPQFSIAFPRDFAGPGVGTSTDEWVYAEDSSRVQQMSFNTPYGAAPASICGRVAYSGFHVANQDNTALLYFPSECSNGTLSTQELILAFNLFDLSACVSEGDPIAPPQCTRRTAAQLCPNANDACGLLPDGCGGVVDCGGCASGNYCDGQTCRPNNCTPATCASLGFNCGSPPDGCGGIARNAQGQQGCGDCGGNPQNCGLGGPGICGTSSCTPRTRAQACPTNSCGLVGDGCGGAIDCGGCATGQVCGGGGANRCGASSCTPLSRTAACSGLNCGLVSDGCGGTVDCGSCIAPDSCGGGGSPNVCGHPACTPLSQTQACQGLQCGFTSDGCGGAINCGTCPNGGTCGGAGPNLCGASCSPTTCEAQGAECGAISDRCGGIVQCPNCPSGEICGSVSPNHCDPGPACTPTNCTAVNAECGLVGDGCGGVLSCGTCQVAGQTCGGAGVPNRCGAGTGGCTPTTCGAQNVQCGAASDGCGGVLDCGGCGAVAFCQRGQCVPVQG
jgi:hypothetical protein